MTNLLRALLLACLLSSLSGCERQVRSMYQQPRYDPGEASALFADGKAARPPPPGSVAAASGDLAGTSSGRRGRELPMQAAAAYAVNDLAQVTPALLRRGRERYTIYCLPCHSPIGDGDGPVVRRGFPHPPSYREQRLRDAPDRHFFDVMTQGHGVMYSYADRVPPEDRWAIVAYIRSLQSTPRAQGAAR